MAELVISRVSSGDRLPPGAMVNIAVTMVVVISAIACAGRLQLSDVVTFSAIFSSHMSGQQAVRVAIQYASAPLLPRGRRNVSRRRADRA